MSLRTILGSLVVSLLAVACGGASGDTGDDTLDATGGKVFLCTGFGSNDTTFLNVTSTGITATVEGGAIYRGTSAPGGDASTVVFGNFIPANGFFENESMHIPKSLFTSGASTKVQLNNPTVNPQWDGTCRKATNEELAADHCLPLLQYWAPIDTNKKASIVKSGSGYKATMADAQAGDLVYQIDAKVDGLLCTLGDETPVSCSAVVADKRHSRPRVGRVRVRHHDRRLLGQLPGDEGQVDDDELNGRGEPRCGRTGGPPGRRETAPAMRAS
jgi:hypothetical protein